MIGATSSRRLPSGVGVGVAVGLGACVGVGGGVDVVVVGEGVGDALGVVPGLAEAAIGLGGGAKPIGGQPNVAKSMKSCQIGAARTPPNPGPYPGTSGIGSSASASPTHTPVTSCGTYPTNQASS